MSTTPVRQSIKSSQDFWANPFFNQHARRAFSAYAKFQMAQMQSHVLSEITPCESPLEAAFYTWWIVLNSVGASSLELVPQHEVIAHGRRYRLDFLVRPVQGRMYSSLLGCEDAPKVAIELDGHHYHDKKKSQVTKRNRRDRDLASDVWTVFHASFSEFHDDAIGTVTSLFEDTDRIYQGVIGKRLLQA